MNTIRFASTLLALSFAAASPALADDDDDRKGRKRQREHKEAFWDGPCKVEREWKKNGDYKEERKCEGRVARRGPPVVVAPAPAAYPPWVVVERGAPVYRPGHEPAPVRGSVSHCNSDTVGQVLGGIAGAAIGSQIGKGSGRAVATIGGTVAGVLIGGEIGRRIDARNQACIGQALEFAPAGQRVEWPADGTQYAVVPGRVVQRNGTHCRPFEAEVMTSAGWQKTRGTACRRPDGTWVSAG